VTGLAAAIQLKQAWLKEFSMLNTLAYWIAAVVIGLLNLLPFVIALVIVEHLFGRARRAWRTDATRTDIGFLVLSTVYGPLVRHFLTLIVAVIAIPTSWISGWNATTQSWNLLVQVLVFLLVRDILIFARHRLFHTRRMWPFHAIHHSSREVNWLSSARFHPVESIVEVAFDVLLSSVLSLSPTCFQLVACLIGFNNFFIHSNCSWTYGPLRWILVSPVFHRWHHSVERAAWNKNYAAMFSFFDLICGTFYMPKGKYPEQTGIPGPSRVPESLLGQLMYPFLRAK
jgi:sterol desaturase/sphingolipid hydroxylase (fatty acid hydroxylase superfamily)